MLEGLGGKGHNLAQRGLLLVVFLVPTYISRVFTKVDALNEHGATLGADTRHGGDARLSAHVTNALRSHVSKDVRQGLP